MQPKFELGKLRDGGIVMMCDESFPANVKHVEYYCDAKIFVLVFYTTQDGEPDHMVNYELKDGPAQTVEESKGETILLVDAKNTKELKGYNVPLLKLGPRTVH